MAKVKMLETRLVAPDGITVVEWEKGEEYEAADPDLVNVLLAEGAAETVEPKKQAGGKKAGN